MLRRYSPLALLDQQVTTLQCQLVGVWDGDVNAIHDARVATRRIRELIDLAAGGTKGEITSEAALRFRQIGKALGKVRDVDVRIGLLRNLEIHAPHSAPTMVVLRLSHDRERVRKMRNLIKDLEGVEVDVLLKQVRAGRRGRHAFGWFGTGAWRVGLRDQIASRAHDAADRMQHATGVYFPNRSHSARIALKKLRYAAEIAESLGAFTLSKPLKALKKGQELLGHLHDRQVLMDLIAAHREEPGVVAEHLQLALQVLEGDLRENHGRYLARRAKLTEAVGEIAASVEQSALPQRMALLGGALAVAGLVTVGARREG